MTDIQQIEELIRRRKELDKAEEPALMAYIKAKNAAENLTARIESLSCRELLPMSDTEQWDHWTAYWDQWDVTVWYKGRSIEILDSTDKPNSPDSIRGRVGEYPPAETMVSLIEQVYRDFNAKPLPLSDSERAELAELRGKLETLSRQEHETRERRDSIEQELREIEPRIRELEYEWVQGRPLREQWPVVMRRLTESGYRVYGYHDRYLHRDELEVIHWDGMEPDEWENYEDETRLVAKRVPTDETVIQKVLDEYHKLYATRSLS